LKNNCLIICSPKRQRVADLIPKSQKRKETDSSKIKQSYNLFEDEYVTIASKKEIRHLNKYDAIGHVLLMGPDGIKEVRKVIERMLVKGEYRNRLMEQLDNTTTNNVYTKKLIP